MASVTHKTEIGPIDGTPLKRMFWSIISDYGLKTGICELIDNALDLWMSGGKRRPLEIDVGLNTRQQIITVKDNSGGLKQDELLLLIAPGGSKNDPDDATIGIFGVGGKRAGIALGEYVRLKTRAKRADTFEIEITPDWLESDDWHIPYSQIPDITAGTTEIEISRLRKQITDHDVQLIKEHIAETYSWFLNEGCVIRVNGDEIISKTFEQWSYPANFAPRRASFDVELSPGEAISVTVIGGLIRDRDPVLENYGVYFYCNHRLIVKELRERQVGYFISTEAGVPHPDASLCRVIVELQGAAKLMPWTSSKSGINYNHPAFERVSPTIIQLTSHFSSLSRRLKHDWDGQVFSHTRGTIEDVEPEDAAEKNPLVLPPLPKVRKKQVEKLKTKNKRIINDKPWTLGLVESMAAVEVITRQQRFDTKNRIALLLLDSNFEIALKEYIVHDHQNFPPRQYGTTQLETLFARRSNVINAVTQHVQIPAPVLAKANHFYGIRNKLVHERATVEPTDADIKSYRTTIEKVLKILFGLKF